MNILDRFSLPKTKPMLQLHFPKEGVKQLANHAKKSIFFSRSYMTTSEGSKLWLVADKGIYLVSNGLPALFEDGTTGKTNDETGPLYAIWADGINPKVDSLEDILRRKGLLFEGNDGISEIPVVQFYKALSQKVPWIEMTCDMEGTPIRIEGKEVLDGDFDQRNSSHFKSPVLRDPTITEQELLDLIKGIVDMAYPDDRHLNYWLELLAVNIPSPNITDYIFWSDDELTPEQILKKAEADKPILL